ncbi:MAG: porin, partial [Burkholderiaceae bacterium]|nr:porin [Burkholderiaceae bacterium]
MKTRLFLSGISLAGMSAFSPTVSAQSNVVLYGIADLGIHYSNGLNASNAPTASNSTTALSSGINNTSRWGIKGQEALGNDMSALFQLEGGLNVDTGGSAKSDKLFDRIAFV